MPKDILFISDLHLSLDKPEITRRFLGFLQKRAPQAAALYILGDLFDAWIGDDDYTPPNGTIRKQLKQLTDSGTQVYLQPGNRDFLLGQRFCQDTGVVLLNDYAVLDLSGTPTLLTHGDLLCTDDLPYQAFRNKSRSLDWQKNVLSKPLLIRLLAARWYRLRSFFHKRKKSQEIMDVNQDTVINIMRGHGCLRLIHGHTHRPAVHHFEIDGKSAQRFVLAAWHKQAGDALNWNGVSYQREVI
ncbi:MAG: UDP-2,3-diacylglucosamine diphosphatase [Methylovulum sp.]|uniref:UDP-2,3-diacylglucosamine diphosphatase n=1 Tax=Methylovulum sp. TaxID=1916980 RepID=UPI0026201101|nr:UDP-2,3-diacylglucosamine diphosphatase [Methylovulum sp.]MDD2725270.1 UDP-2,3-diacylglucosamine diphosphatase [Methylovulum sp.]MDD5125859.1 UDP-2,3-diacylglucosamine diphosphatase [Methylovulum sp.]